MRGLRLVSPVVLVTLLSACANHTPATPSDVAQPVAAPTVAVPPTAATGAAPPATIASRIDGFRADLDLLQQHIDQDRRSTNDLWSERSQLTNTYVTTVSAIDGRLEAGTTPGNPDVMTMWHSASDTVDALGLNLSKLSDASAAISSDSTTATYLASTVHAAFGLQGAYDADHAKMVQIETQSLADMETLDQLHGTTTDAMADEANALAAERRDLSTLLHAVEVGAPLGPNLSNGAARAAKRSAVSHHHHDKRATLHKLSGHAALAHRAHPVGTKGRLLIGTDEFQTDYEPRLYALAAAARAHSSSASITVVVELPGAGAPLHKADAVLATRHLAASITQALVSYGIPRDHIVTISKTRPTIRSGEVFVYSRH